MTHKLLISQQEGTSLEVESLASDFGVQLEQISEQRALLLDSSPDQIIELQQRGYRVKPLPNTNLLNIGKFSIDIESDLPTIDPTLEIPSELSDGWTHFLVQFISYPEQEWLVVLERHGINILDPLPPYGYVIQGSPAEIQSLEDLAFVAWVGPFKPAYRLSPNLEGLTGRIQYISLSVIRDGDVNSIRATIAALSGEIISEENLEELSADKYHRLTIEINAKNLIELGSIIRCPLD